MFPGAQQEQKVFTSNQYSFAGGINDALPAARLEDNQVVDIVNLRFNDEDSLVPRSGTDSVLSQIAAADITTPITSVFSAYYNNAGTPLVRDFFTVNNGNVYSFSAGVATLLSAGGGSTQFCQWKMYGDLAILANGETVTKRVNAAGVFADLGSSVPTGTFVEVWADRVWLSGSIGTASDPNTLFGSALGNATDWTTTGTAGRVIIAIEPNDGDFITGLCAFRERLFIFKRNRIYVVQPISGGFSSDASALSVDLYAQNIGCISGYSIQPVLDDVLFLTENGVASLVASERVGDFTSALLSKNISGFRDTRTAEIKSYEIGACVVPEHNQYWLLLPSDFGVFGVSGITSETARENAAILDYSKIQQGLVRWSRFVGAAAGRVMCKRVRVSDALPSYYIGGRIDGDATTYRIWEYIPADFNGLEDQYSVNRAIAIKLYTQAYDFNMPGVRKDFQRMFFDFIPVSSSTTVDVRYYLDEDNARTGTWSILMTSGVSGPATIGGRASDKKNRKFLFNSTGARGTNVTFIIFMNTINKAFGINSLSVSYSLLPDKRVNY